MTKETLLHLKGVQRFVEEWEPHSHTSTYKTEEVDAVRDWALDTWPHVSVLHKEHGDESRISFVFAHETQRNETTTKD